MTKFLLTRELGRLARWLRILGFDARYEPSVVKSLVMIEALKEDRVVVTRNQHFGTRHGGTVIFLKSDRLEDQLSDLLRKTNIRIDEGGLFSRCILCNVGLEFVDKEGVKDKVAPYIYETQDEFKRCPLCLRIYWKGTHWGNVDEIIKKLKQ